MPASCADLSIGQCVDRQIRCADHHWRFDGASNCVDIHASDRIPPGAKLFSYPAAEASGLVWAFNGETPLFGLPRIPGIVEHDLAFEARLRGIGQVPPWVSTSNGVDFQQLRTLHNLPTSALKAVTVRDYMVEYRVEATGYMQHGLITGTNAFAQHFAAPGDRCVAGTPIDACRSRGRRSVEDRRQHCRTVGRQRRPSGSVRLCLDTMRFRKGVLVASDRHLARYLKYVGDFPPGAPPSE